MWGRGGEGRAFAFIDNDAEGSAELSRKTPVTETLFFHLSVGVRDVLQTEYDND